VAQPKPKPEGFEESLDDDTLKPTFTASDIAQMRLVERAARNGWHVPDAFRTKSLEECYRVLEYGDMDQKLVAVKTLLAMDAHDQRDAIERAKLDASDKHHVWVEMAGQVRKFVIPETDDRPEPDPEG